MNSSTQEYLHNLITQCREELLESVLPFWLEHGLDREYGGMLTCVDRDGTLMDGTKSVWFQGRAAYILSYVYNHVDPRPEYLAAAKSILDFAEQHCVDPEDGRWYFEVTREGLPLRKRRYVFSETFGIIAMAEYALASGDKSYAVKALKLFRQVQEWLETPGALPPKYLPTQPAIGHSILMILMNTAAVLRQVVDDPILERQVEKSYEAIRHKLWHPEYHIILESVTPEGNLIDTLGGRTINPGHCIETSWFLMEVGHAFPSLPISDEMRTFGLEVLDGAWEWGWDEPYGGVINFLDCKGFPSQDYSQDMKFWWPQTEAAIAHLYAYKETGREEYLESHKKALDWAWTHLRDAEYPEWYGYLHRDGTVAQPAKGNLFKGPFHIPRMLTKLIILSQELLGE